ncbi:electron transfer flavoprotein subunit beta/FixA family protein [Mangrovivirga sp. M17]|uniref:Electron transfer flavoprotein subunit beta n=1 Tax=Mangrovivirga halotolerans TaxID=2993936 RepID=A0ABT3RVK4_9BACT|nr:electron transfer flavoprotein subunit beta/FixA family protein [Mangrovivirga halotolerans]MCX2745666.1 electron transfer flavoprotein subunit beta/FixA family protein [Mangrovivirga halotolerans]
MKILVCITHVPDTTSKISFTDNNTKFDSSGVQYIIGPYDDYALARAVELKESNGATVTVLNVGTSETEPTIRKALAIGADDAIRVDAFPENGHFVAEQIAHIAKENNYDLILMGRESIDYNGGAVHGMVGEMLGLPSLSPVMTLDIEGNTAKMAREIEGGKEYVEVDLPFVAGCQEPIAEWKIPNMRGIMTARTKPLNVVEAVDTTEKTELKNYELPPEKGDCKMIDPDNVEELVDLLKNEAKVL